MDTVDKLAAYCKEHEIEDIHVMGAPKTIDNDLVELITVRIQLRGHV